MEPKCRVCLSTASNAPLSSLTQTNIFMLKSINSSFTVLNANDVENLSSLKAFNNICSFCQTVLNLLYEFQQKMVRSEREMLQQISSLEEKVFTPECSLTNVTLFGKKSDLSELSGVTGPVDENYSEGTYRPELNDDDEETPDPFNSVFVKSEIDSNDGEGSNDFRRTRMSKRRRTNPEQNKEAQTDTPTNEKELLLCEHCSYSTTIKYQLNFHLKKHLLKAKKFKVREAASKLPLDNINWNQHLKETQAGSVVKFSCNFCNEEFIDNLTAMSHVRETHFRGRLMESQKGGRVLVCDGFIYSINNVWPERNVINWNCIEECTGTAKTQYYNLKTVESNTEVDVRILRKHMHDRDFVGIEVREVMLEIKRRGREEPHTESNEIVKQALDRVHNSAVLERLPKRESLMRIVRRYQSLR